MKLIKDNIPFTMVANEVLYSPNLSFKAKGLYAYLFSKPDEWDFSSNRIVLETKDGRKSIMASLRELEDIGALVRQKLPNGKMEYILKFSTQSPETALRLNNGLKQPKSLNGTVPKRLSAESSPISNKEEKVIKDEVDKSTSSFSVVQTDEMGGLVPIVDKKEKSSGRNTAALRIRAKFIEIGEKRISIKPIANDKKSYVACVRALKELSEEKIYDLFDWWFGQNLKEEDLLSINRSLSGYSITKYKVENNVK